MISKFLVAIFILLATNVSYADCTVIFYKPSLSFGLEDMPIDLREAASNHPILVRRLINIFPPAAKFHWSYDTIAVTAYGFALFRGELETTQLTITLNERNKDINVKINYRANPGINYQDSLPVKLMVDLTLFARKVGIIEYLKFGDKEVSISLKSQQLERLSLVNLYSLLGQPLN